jgi:hypothetical protein
MQCQLHIRQDFTRFMCGPQATARLTETGVVDADTWKALMGPEATPAFLSALTNEFEDDLTDDSEAMWLLGEQRWERRKKVPSPSEMGLV